MKKNMGLIDRIVRLTLAAIFIVLYITGATDGTLGIILLILSGILILTSLVGFCPLYRLFNLKTTCKNCKTG